MTENSTFEIPLIPTGCRPLDHLLGGGLPVGKLTLFDVRLPADSAALTRAFEPMWARGVRRISIGDTYEEGVIWTRTDMLPQDDSGIMQLGKDAAKAGSAIIAVHGLELPKVFKFWAWVRFTVEGEVLKCIKNAVAPCQGYVVRLDLGPEDPLPDYIAPKLAML